MGTFATESALDCMKLLWRSQALAHCRGFALAQNRVVQPTYSYSGRIDCSLYIFSQKAAFS